MPSIATGSSRPVSNPSSLAGPSVEAPSFDGIWVPLVTPLRDDRIDPPALRRLVRHLAAQGVAGFMPCGSSGEAQLLDEGEQAEVLACVLDAANGLPVVAGLAGSATRPLAARAARLAGQLPQLAGLLVSAPAYVRPSQAGIADHFRAIADAGPLPLVLYDVPARTGVRIRPETLLALAEHPRIRAVKDCSGDLGAALQLLADGRLAWLAGNDDEMFTLMAHGAHGAVSATAHLRADLFVRLHRLLAGQQLQAARALWQRLQPLTRAAFVEPNPMPVKAALAAQGWLQNELRAPLHPAAAATAETLATLLAALDDSRPG